MKWIIISIKNENYDLDGAIRNCGVDWKRNNKKYETGDIVYIYECDKEYIKYKCVVTEDHKTISSLDDEKYGGYGIGVCFGEVQIETKLIYEFKKPIKINELSAHGMRTGRKTIMKETGKRPELFKFIEEYEKEDRKQDDYHVLNSDNDDEVPGEDIEITTKGRKYQDRFRKSLLSKYNHCCLCAVSNTELLKASHIKPWKFSTPEEKTNQDNGLLLCPNHDELFDRGFISFDENGNILISKELSKHDRIFMNVNENMRINLNGAMEKNMKFHRENIFKE